MKKYKIAIIAGEASGDLIGAKLLSALKKRMDYEVVGVGGSNMLQCGFKSIFPMQDIAVMGYAELIPKLPKILLRLRQTVHFIQSFRPDILITIDSPGFNLRLIQKIRSIQSLEGLKIIHYVAPTIWAYAPERAAKFAKLYDHLLTILPFEKPYFDAVGLPCTYVGHHIMEEPLPQESKENLKAKYGYHTDIKLITITPGSRECELRLHMPIILATATELLQKYPNIQFIMPTLPHLLNKCISMVKDANLSQYFKIESDTDIKRELMYCSDAALIKSGTIALECARMQVPMIMFYKILPLTAFLIKRKLRIKYINLCNIMANQLIIPELLQDQCNVENLTNELEKILLNGQEQIEALAPYLKQFETMINPSDMAADMVLHFCPAARSTL